MEWDEFTDLATAAYNFIENVTSMESPFLLSFGRDPYMPLNQLMVQARKYLNTEEDTQSSTKFASNDNNTDGACS